MLFGTSEEFLRCFDLSSLSELPDIDLEYNFGELNHEIIEGEQIEFVKETENNKSETLTDDINE